MQQWQKLKKQKKKYGFNPPKKQGKTMGKISVGLIGPKIKQEGKNT